MAFNIFKKKEAASILEENPRVLRPLNYPKGTPGHGFVVMATGLTVRIDPVLGGVVAVFPGIFATSLGVMGFSQSAFFSARMAQNAIPGIISILLFVLGYSV